MNDGILRGQGPTDFGLCVLIICYVINNEYFTWYDPGLIMFIAMMIDEIRDLRQQRDNYE